MERQKMERGKWREREGWRERKTMTYRKIERDKR